MNKNFDDFKDAVNKLHLLVNDPEPCSMAWHMCMSERMDEITKMYYGQSDVRDVVQSDMKISNAVPSNMKMRAGEC